MSDQPALETSEQNALRDEDDGTVHSDKYRRFTPMPFDFGTGQNAPRQFWTINTSEKNKGEFHLTDHDIVDKWQELCKTQCYIV